MFHQHALASMLLLLMCLVLGTSAGTCNMILTQPIATMGPLAVQSVIVNNSACFRVTMTSSTAQWISISVSPSNSMVNSPVVNCIIYDRTSGPQVGILAGYSSSDVPTQPNASVIFYNASAINDVLQVTFERPLASASVYDHPISSSPSDATTIIWAYGDSTWPAMHPKEGAVSIMLGSGTIVDSASGNGTQATTAIIAVVTFACMIFGGWIIRRRPPHYLVAMSKRSTPLHDVVADLTLAESFVMLTYAISLAVVAISVVKQNSNANGNRLVCLITGHETLVILVFLMLPVARGKHWEVLLGVSHERLLKFHRYLGRLWLIPGVIHLLTTDATWTSSNEYGSAIPLFGLLAFFCFLSLTLMGYESIRRWSYEQFYFHHRIFSIVGLILALLHAPAIQIAMIFPLVIYVLSAILRTGALFNQYTATIIATSDTTAVLTLSESTNIQQLINQMNLGNFFYLNVPGVSRYEWHPFSGILTPDGKSIVFCIKSMNPGSFVNKVIHSNSSTNGCAVAPECGGTSRVLIGGPYGLASLNPINYSVCILLAGGIGITPHLHFINRMRHQPTMSDKSVYLHWVVRTEKELLMCAPVMFPLPPNIKATFYVTQANSNGDFVGGGQEYSYQSGRLSIPNVLQDGLYAGIKVAVFACGPPGLVHEAQASALACGADFHKEEFSF